MERASGVTARAWCVRAWHRTQWRRRLLQSASSGSLRASDSMPHLRLAVPIHALELSVVINRDLGLRNNRSQWYCWRATNGQRAPQRKCPRNAVRWMILLHLYARMRALLLVLVLLLRGICALASSTLMVAFRMVTTEAHSRTYILIFTEQKARSSRM